MATRQGVEDLDVVNEEEEEEEEEEPWEPEFHQELLAEGFTQSELNRAYLTASYFEVEAVRKVLIEKREEEERQANEAREKEELVRSCAQNPPLVAGLGRAPGQHPDKHFDIIQAHAFQKWNQQKIGGPEKKQVTLTVNPREKVDLDAVWSPGGPISFVYDANSVDTLSHHFKLKCISNIILGELIEGSTPFTGLVGPGSLSEVLALQSTGARVVICSHGTWNKPLIGGCEQKRTMATALDTFCNKTGVAKEVSQNSNKSDGWIEVAKQVIEKGLHIYFTGCSIMQPELELFRNRLLPGSLEGHRSVTFNTIYVRPDNGLEMVSGVLEEDGSYSSPVGHSLAEFPDHLWRFNISDSEEGACEKLNRFVQKYQQELYEALNFGAYCIFYHPGQKETSLMEEWLAVEQGWANVMGAYKGDPAKGGPALAEKFGGLKTLQQKVDMLNAILVRRKCGGDDPDSQGTLLSTIQTLGFEVPAGFVSDALRQASYAGEFGGKCGSPDLYWDIDVDVGGRKKLRLGVHSADDWATFLWMRQGKVYALSPRLSKEVRSQIVPLLRPEGSFCDDTSAEIV